LKNRGLSGVNVGYHSGQMKRSKLAEEAKCQTALGLAEKAESYLTKEGLKRNGLGFKNFLKHCCNLQYQFNHLKF